MHTHSPTTVTPTSARFLAALRELDFEGLERCLAPDVWFRTLLPRRVHESKTARETARTLRDWIEGHGDGRLLESDHSVSIGRERIRYRFLLRPKWAPDQWHVMEQTGSFKQRDGKISRLDLVCSGYHPSDASGRLE
jgi:hypothetical protein